MMPTIESTMELKYREPIPQLDLCLTDIQIPERYRSLLLPKERTLLFSELIASRKFAPIRERAKRVYDLMEGNGAYCPTITSIKELPHAIYMRWEEEGRLLIVSVIPEIPFAFARGRVEEFLANNVVESDEQLYKLLPAFAKFVSPRIYRGEDVTDSRRGNRGGKVK